MSITEMIKEAIVFPSKDLGPLAIYIVMTIIMAFLSFGGFIYAILTDDIVSTIIGIIISIIAIIIELILMGYQIKLIKTGIDNEETAPAFEWKEDCITGIKYLVVKIVYCIIPALITFIVALATNVPANINSLLTEITNSFAASSSESALSTFATLNSTANSTDYMAAFSSLNSTNGTNAIPAIHVSDAVINSLVTSLTITAIVALIVFLIFAILQFIAEARLANNGSLGGALNFIEVFKDIGKIGYGKVIGTFLLIVIVVAVINLVFGFIVGFIPVFWIFTLILTPYLLFFSKRTAGLLYSDIA